MTKKKQAHPYTPDYNRGDRRQVRTIEGPSMAKQSEAAACDVNNIIRKYDRTGVITHLQRAEAVYADVSEIGSYQEAVETVQNAQSAFDALPSGLRANFGNDPARFLDWANTATQEERSDLYAQLTGGSRDQDANPTATPHASPPADADPPSE